MVIGKIKPSATLVAQFPAGVEVDAIQHEGRIFMPVVSMGEFATTEEPAPAKKDEPAPSKPAAPASESKSAKTASSGKTYTEDELMEMDTKSLLKMCKEMGIDPDATDGKNTNKKLRTLILSAQEEGGDGDNNEETEETASEENSELVGQVGEILEDFDAGKKNKKKAISAIVALGEDVDVDAVTELVEGFEDDADTDIDDVAKKIADVIAGGAEESEEEEEEEKPAKKSPKKGGKKEPKEELVDVDDLEVGDRVSVYWDDENKDWFDGEVKSIKKGKVVIAYDDDTEEPIDPEVHTKIKRLAE